MIDILIAFGIGTIFGIALGVLVTTEVILQMLRMKWNIHIEFNECERDT